MAFVARRAVEPIGYPHAVRAALADLQAAVLADDTAAQTEASRQLSHQLELLDDSGEGTGRNLPADLVSYIHAMDELNLLTFLSDQARDRLNNRYGHVASLLNDHEYRKKAPALANPTRLDQLMADASDGLDAHAELRASGLSAQDRRGLQVLLALDAAERSDQYAKDSEQAGEQKSIGRGQEVATALLAAGVMVTGTDMWELFTSGGVDLLGAAAGAAVVGLGITSLLRESVNLTAEAVSRQVPTGTIETDVASFIPRDEPSDPGEGRHVRLTAWAARQQAARTQNETAAQRAREGQERTPSRSISIER